jgi:hypothetical protein
MEIGNAPDLSAATLHISSFRGTLQGVQYQRSADRKYGGRSSRSSGLSPPASAVTILKKNQ